MGGGEFAPRGCGSGFRRVSVSRGRSGLPAGPGHEHPSVRGAFPPRPPSIVRRAEERRYWHLGRGGWGLSEIGPAHNPKVAGSNPAPAISRSPLTGGFRRFWGADKSLKKGGGARGGARMGFKSPHRSLAIAPSSLHVRVEIDLTRGRGPIGLRRRRRKESDLDVDRSRHREVAGEVPLPHAREPRAGAVRRSCRSAQGRWTKSGPRTWSTTSSIGWINVRRRGFGPIRPLPNSAGRRARGRRRHRPPAPATPMARPLAGSHTEQVDVPGNEPRSGPPN
jgi:hypothetical protein